MQFMDMNRLIFLEFKFVGFYSLSSSLVKLPSFLEFEFTALSKIS